jgi:hypothetical protein
MLRRCVKKLLKTSKKVANQVKNNNFHLTFACGAVIFPLMKKGQAIPMDIAA